jgi:hypothetical protein
VGPDELIRYAIGTTARPTLGGFPPAHSRPPLGRIPGYGHPPLDPPGRATLRGSGPEPRLGATEDSERPEAGGPSGAMGRDPPRDVILQGT